MVSDTLEQRIYELVRSHDGIYLFKKKELTPSTDLDSDLRLEDDEALALMDDFFTTFNVDRGSFSITTYYPPEPPLKHLLNPFRKNDIPQVPDFTIGMLIASARAGRWLYELIHAGGLLFAFRYYGAHNVYYVKCTRTIKRHVKAAGFLHVKKLLAHKFAPAILHTISRSTRRAGIKKPAIVFGSSLSVCQSRMKSSRSVSASAHGISDGKLFSRAADNTASP